MRGRPQSRRLARRLSREFRDRLPSLDRKAITDENRYSAAPSIRRHRPNRPKTAELNRSRIPRAIARHPFGYLPTRRFGEPAKKQSRHPATEGRYSRNFGHRRPRYDAGRIPLRIRLWALQNRTYNHQRRLTRCGFHLGGAANGELAYGLERLHNKVHNKR